MVVFPHFNPATECPICHTTRDKPAVLIEVDGTARGNNEMAEGMQIHLECLQPRVVRALNGDVLIWQLCKAKQ